MQIGAKLLVAFVVVILVMMIGTGVCVAYLDYKVTRDAAAKLVTTALQRIALDKNCDFKTIIGANGQIGQAIGHDSAIMNPFFSGDRTALAANLKTFLGKTDFSGVVTFIDKNQNVLYSTDSPSIQHFSVAGNPALKNVFVHGDTFFGATELTGTQNVCLSVVLPISANGKNVAGALAISTPMDAQFLTGIVEKLAISPAEHISGIDIVLLDNKGDIVGITPNLAGQNNAYVKQLNDTKWAALPVNTSWPAWVPGSRPAEGFESANRWWKPLNMAAVDDKIMAVMLVTAPVPGMVERLKVFAILSLAFGGLGLLVALVFAAGLSKGVNEPLRFLIHRTEKIATQRAALPPLEGLTGDWLELGEQIDTAVTGMRSTVQHLRMQLQKQQQDTSEQGRQAEDVHGQLDQLNKQFSLQSKQLNELNRQSNTASRQAILLQHKLDSVLQVSTEGFLILDQFGNVLSANPVFLNWLGANEGEIAGRLCFDLVKRPGEPPDSMHEGQAFARHGGDPHALINQFYPDGVVYHRYQQRAVEVMAHLQPVMSEDSNIQGYIMVLRDKSLRSEIAQLRGEIVAMLSESIRVPLTAAESAWTSVLSNAVQTMHPSVGQPLAELHGHYEQLLGVVDSLLMMYGGYVPPPVAPKEPIVITRLVADCLEEVAPLARHFQLALDYRSSPLPSVELNKEAVKNTLINVLQRMITLTAAGGRVRVETMIKGSEMRIGVQSSGPALSEAEIGDLFAGFIEGKHDEASYSARLSMYLARNTVERFGGKIWAESEAGRGTVVYFTVPVVIIG